MRRCFDRLQRGIAFYQAQGMERARECSGMENLGHVIAQVKTPRRLALLRQERTSHLRAKVP